MDKRTYLDFRNALIQLGETTSIRERTMIAISPDSHPRHWRRLMTFATHALTSSSADESIKDQLLFSALDQLMCDHATDAVSCLESLIDTEPEVLDAFIIKQREGYQVLYAVSFAESLKMTYAELLKHSLHVVVEIRRAIRRGDYLDSAAIAAALNPN